MNATAKIQHKGQVTIPTRLRNQAGQNADDEYTPAQRRIIDARLAKSDEDIKHGWVYGPFDTHEEFLAALHKEAAQPVKKKTRRTAR
jgi:bifunctional DNA-binding transcriptional regulator/antitoxin component of YhaV-PrlF toxin-antitoxin module